MIKMPKLIISIRRNIAVGFCLHTGARPGFMFSIDLICLHISFWSAGTWNIKFFTYWSKVK